MTYIAVKNKNKTKQNKQNKTNKKIKTQDIIDLFGFGNAKVDGGAIIVTGGHGREPSTKP